MRLCYISNPNSMHTRRWLGWFTRHGHEVCLLADIPPKSAFPEVQVIDLSQIFYARVIRFPVWAAWCRRFLRRWHPDILHAHRVNSAGWLAASSGFHPYVISPWGSDVFIQPQRSRIARWLARYSLGHADLVTVNSQAMASQVIQLGARMERVQHVQFGVEMDIFNLQDLTQQQNLDLRKRLSLPENSPLVLCPRAINPIYHIDVILRAIPQVRQHVPGVVFLFINYNIDQDYKKRLLKTADDLGVEDSIRWLQPVNQRRDLAELYHLCDVIVSVPASDGTPVSVLEAMACGKPVIVSDLLPLREYIQDGENGWVVPVGEHAPLAEKIIRLLDDPATSRDLGMKANLVVSQASNYDLEMQRMESLYDQLVKTGLR